MAENLGISCPILYPSDLNSLATPQVWPGYNVYGGGADIFLEAPPPGSGNPPSPTSAACGPGSSLSGNWVTTSDDHLKVSAWSSVNPTLIRFYGRHRDPTGELRPFLHDVTATSSSAAVSTTTGVYQGCLTNIHASAPNGVGSATVYVLAQLGKIRGGVFLPHTEVLSGVLTDKGLLSGVSDPNAGGGGGGGGCCVPISLDLVFMPASIAGRSDDSWSTPSPQSFKFRNCGAFFDTTACAVATYVGLGVSESGQDDFYARHPTAIPAGITGTIVWYKGAEYNVQNNRVWTAPIPDMFVISGGGISLGQSDGDLNMVLTDPYYSREFYT